MGVRKRKEQLTRRFCHFMRKTCFVFLFPSSLLFCCIFLVKFFSFFSRFPMASASVASSPTNAAEGDAKAFYPKPPTRSLKKKQEMESVPEPTILCVFLSLVVCTDGLLDPVFLVCSYCSAEDADLKKALALGTQVFLSYRKGDITQWMEAAQFIKKVSLGCLSFLSFCFLLCVPLFCTRFLFVIVPLLLPSGV